MTTDADEGEDKIGKSAREKGLDPWQIVERFSQAFFEDMETLRLQPADQFPRATEHVPDMIHLVERILENGFAYEANGSVYFDLMKFPDYGRLSGNTLAELMAGHRVERNPEKKSPYDFALWKAAPNSFMKWDSPWSTGVPGWHVECTAMAMRYLGEQIDIHTGGEDNIFPHHECEIAQAETATGKSPYCRFWMHNRHLLVENTKMSKSLGNFYTLRDLIDQGHSPLAIRYLLLSSHYRAPLNFTLEGLDAAAKAVDRINDFVARLDEAPEADGGPDVAETCEKAKEDFAAALDQDLNVSEALAVVHEFMHEINRTDLTAQAAKPVRKVMHYFDSVLDVLEEQPRAELFQIEDRVPPFHDEGEEAEISSADSAELLQMVMELHDAQQTRKLDVAAAAQDQLLTRGISDLEVGLLIQTRRDAREARDFAKADAIRNGLALFGIELEDTPQGTRWRRKKA
jgi:cysteinyl-tRNA synthetase